MKTVIAIAMLALSVGYVTSSEKERAPLKETVFRPLTEKPETSVRIGPAEAAAYWKRVVPPHLTEQPASDLREFKRTHAHQFWEPYLDRTITVSGEHYCVCCFYAAIGYGYFGRGYTEGWTIRLDEYIAIGFPQGSTGYTNDGETVAMKGPFRPLWLNMTAVGTVIGPHSITNSLGLGIHSQAIAYYILQQENRKTPNQ